jgi:hypothetical protein
MKILIEIIVCVLSLYLAYRLYKRYNKILGLYIDEVTSDWPDIPNWFNWTLGILLFLGCIFAQVTIFFESLIIWLILLIIIPFFYLPIINGKIYNFLSVTTFFLTAFFSITLFFSVDNSRDVIGESFIPNYEVYYTTEYVQTDYGDEEIEVAHVNTGSDTLDFLLESIFPFAYRILIGFIVIFSLLMNVFLRGKNKIIKNGYNNT